ncbi:MAG: NADAR family protein [Anaerolineae bacterium]
MSNAITQFRDDYHFLSNFFPADVSLDGVDYPTVEHAFQAAKTFDADQRTAIRLARTPSSAKAMGRRLKRREDWFDVSLLILEELVREKFTRHPELGEKLLATGDAELIEGNTWKDRFYGCVWDAKQNQWVGENHLGRILMKVRDDLRLKEQV